MSEAVSVNVNVSEPAPLGVFGLAVITFVASSQKLGLTSGVTLLIPWAIFLGSGAQFIASLMDFKRNNIFGATVFGAFALFWISMAMAWMLMAGVFGEKLAAMADPRQLGYAFFAFLLFTLPVTVISLETNKTFVGIMVLVDLLLVGLACGALDIGSKSFMTSLAAYSELGIALLSFYCCAALQMNVFFGRVILPVGKPFGLIKRAPV